MTAVAGSPTATHTRPTLRTRLAAGAVLIALMALAAYTMFSGPTRVPLGGPSKVAPRTSVPPAGQGEPENEGGRRD